MPVGMPADIPRIGQTRAEHQPTGSLEAVPCHAEDLEFVAVAHKTKMDDGFFMRSASSVILGSIFIHA